MIDMIRRSNLYYLFVDFLYIIAYNDDGFRLYIYDDVDVFVFLLLFILLIVFIDYYLSSSSNHLSTI